MPQLPPLDVHAHVAPDVPARDLEGLGAVVLAATRSVEEYISVASRSDLVTVWGVGCHPSLVGVQRAFDPGTFREALRRTPFVAEVGLDGSSRVPLPTQLETFAQILSAVTTTPRLTSVHSHQAHAETIEAIESAGTPAGLILHWWLGSGELTARAISLGLSFSINFSMIRNSESWRAIPLDRVLTETDHPSGDRFSPRPRQPGRIQGVEEALARAHGISAVDVRRQIWRNFDRLARDAQVVPMLPRAIRSMMRSV